MKSIVVAGPTACGKSDIGIELAREFAGEIISADSRQVYRNMNIGTGKVEGYLSGVEAEFFKCSDGYFIHPFISENIVHWLIDLIEPMQNFSVADFQKLALEIMLNIVSRSKLPFIVGGTGLYIRSLTEGLVFPDLNVEPELKERLIRLSLEELQKEILQINQEAHLFLDIKNPRRVQRALELLYSGFSLEDMKKKRDTGFSFLVLGIAYDREEINRRIRIRLDKRLEDGMVIEVKNLIDSGVSFERLDSFGLEYRYLSRFLRGILSYDEMYETLYTEICKFAKRQMTWFRKFSNVVWVDDIAHARTLVYDYLNKE